MKTLALLLCLLSSCAFAQTSKKEKIYVSCTCKDQIGERYATALRDAIARSPRYELANSPTEGSGKTASANWALRIVSIDDNHDSPGISTAMSVVFEYGGFLISQRIQICGSDKVDTCASNTLAGVDDDLHGPYR